MKTRAKPQFRLGIALTLGLAGAFALQLATADPRPDRLQPHQHIDARFNHNHVYPDRGFVVRDLPRDRYAVVYGRDRFFFSGGVWYAPRGGAYVVVAPPFGVFVPILPPFYSTVWFGGVPYYYANDTYYLWNGQDNGYEVVAPPAGAESGPDGGAGEPPQPPPASDQLFIYPKNGQSQPQQAKDRYECHTWAASQTGFDPTASGGNVPPGQAAAKSADYNRAMTACLQGRGYSVQ